MEEKVEWSGAQKILKELSKIKHSPPPITARTAGAVGKLALHYIAV
jgi:hypothetical protein